MKNTLLSFILTLILTGTASAQIVGATNNQEVPRTRTSDTSPLYRPTGSYLRFEGGFPIFASVAYCYQITPSFMFGGGVGFGLSGGDHWTNEYDSYHSTFYTSEWKVGGSPCMPVFIEAELRTPRYKWSMFINVKFGYNAFRSSGYIREYYYINGYYGETYHQCLFTASAGVTYKNFSFGGGYSAAYYFNAFVSYNLPL